jgi:hypothetical protein
MLPTVYCANVLPEIARRKNRRYYKEFETLDKKEGRGEVGIQGHVVHALMKRAVFPQGLGF